MQTGFIGGPLGYYLLRWLGRHAVQKDRCSASAYRDRSKVEILLGPQIWSEIAGKVVIDFGCGYGTDAVEMARRGAKKVIGIDIRPHVLASARELAEKAGVSDRCVFSTQTDEKADAIISLDGFEHYEAPDQVLSTMHRLVKDYGRVYIAFGPTWFHPLGGHPFSVFPWAHLIFTEKALIRWRSDFQSDRATRFCEIGGGLNQMTVRRARKLFEDSEFQIKSFETVPIKRLRRLSNSLTREFFTSFVRCTLCYDTDGSMHWT